MNETQFAKLSSMALKASVWIVIFGLLYLLRSFFLLIFLTFVFAYIQANGVNRLETKIANRNLRVVIVAMCFLAVILGIGAFIVPSVREQAKIFGDKAPLYLQTLDHSLVKLSKDYPWLDELLSLPNEDVQNAPPLVNLNPAINLQYDTRKSFSAHLIQKIFGMGEQGDTQANLKNTVDTIKNIGGYFIRLSSAFLLSLLFSFLIVLDLPKLRRSIVGLKNTRLNFIYEETADSIQSFGVVLGRALEAQLLIAILNTLLTAIGVVIMGLTEKLAFISVIVFLCSFIPVAGVFISSVPICLIALQESGFTMLFIAVAMITVVHMVEAYILNPKIYGHHLRLNPVVVLIILTIGGKMFGVWGLVLGVPICTYIFGHAIRYPKRLRGKLATEQEEQVEI